MASCPNCKSNDYRPQEQGVFKDTFYCNSCKKSFELVAGRAKSQGVGFFAGLLAGLFGSDISDNNS